MAPQRSQRTRIWIFLSYVILLVGFNAIYFGEILPQGLWFWAAFLSLLLSEFVTQPYFTAPKDAISNSIAAISIAVPLLSEATAIANNMRFWWTLFFLGGLVVLFMAIGAMVFGESESATRQRFGAILTKISTLVGTPRFLFTVIFFLILFSFYTERNDVILLSFVWIVIVLGQPIQNILRLLSSIMDLWRDLKKSHVIGQIVARREPGLLTVKVIGSEFPSIGTLTLSPSDSDYCQLGIVLDNYRLAEELWTRVLVCEDRVPREDIKNVWGKSIDVLKCDKDIVKSSWLEKPIFTEYMNILGSVVEQSDISLIRIELFRDNVTITEGQLVSVEIHKHPVLYQVINGITQSEILQQSNRHGFMQIEARKLGYWNEDEDSFEQVPWTPQIYTPVRRLAQQTTPKFDQEHIGNIPNTSYGIKVNCNELVTHNTAILGILGSGKTFLALELIQRMISEEIKVWIVDITGQYEGKLGKLIHSQKQQSADETINTAIKATENKQVQNKASGGNYISFASAIKEHINEFLDDDSWRVRVFNPNTYKVTEQTTGLFSNNAGIGDLTITQITRIVAEQLLECLQDRIEVSAPLCLVLEEAHSLVPEWNSVAYDGDKNATNGTAKAILQGRKYGFGCLLITQRTANVTKSILNQCNTIFGLRVFDATGMDFLSNYIGSDYAALLSTLPERHCVAFGRGLNAQSPLLIRLNDQEDKAFTDHFSLKNKHYFQSDEISDDEIPFE